MIANTNDDDDDEFSSSMKLLSELIASSIPALNHELFMKKSCAILCTDDDKSKEKKKRNPSLFDQRLVWNSFVSRHGSRQSFQRHMRMSKVSFYKLLSLIKSDLEVNVLRANARGGPILPEICLYSCLRYCGGGSYSDISFFCGISFASFYRAVWKCIDAINACEALSIRFPQTVEEVRTAAKGFQSISTQGAIWNCVSVVDGYHAQIKVPSKNEVSNVRSFFSGHYQTYGVNVQAACDHNCRFTFLGVAGPGVMGDRDAIKQVTLGSLIEGLPGLFCAIGDCAYTPTEHLVAITGSDMARISKYDNFNFFASQLRIRIEMAFGLMVQKWGILSRPLLIKVKNVKRLMVAIARLHNFCIDERLLSVAHQNQRRGAHGHTFTPTNVEFDAYEQYLREGAATIQHTEMISTYDCPWSHNRERMAKEIEVRRLTRPGKKF
jgi:hypothetical protein